MTGCQCLWSGMFVIRQQLLIILAHCSAVSKQAKATALSGIAMSALCKTQTCMHACNIADH